MSIFEWQASSVEFIAGALAHNIGATRADWLSKQPKVDDSSDTRSVLDQAGECIRVNRMAAALLSGGVPEQSEWAPSSSDEAQRELVASATELASVIRGLDESILTQKFPVPWGEAEGRFMVVMPTFNMAYHMGQVAYAQRLYGDTENHFPG